MPNPDVLYALLERVVSVLDAELERLARDGRGSAEIDHLKDECEEILADLEKL